MLKKTLDRRLVINRETIKPLDSQDMANVAGGLPSSANNVHTCMCDGSPGPTN